MLNWLIYQPDTAFEVTGGALGRLWEDVHFKASDGTKLNGWFLPANAKSRRADLTILVCHGNAGNISHRLELAETMLETGVNVFRT